VNVNVAVVVPVAVAVPIIGASGTKAGVIVHPSDINTFEKLIAILFRTLLNH
jgi:hypothetical protein